MNPFSWMSSSQYLAQIGHFFGAYALIFTVGAFFGGGVLAYALIVGIGVAAIKEFIFDTASWGEGDSWKDSAMDFAFYVFGGLVALGVFELLRR